MMRLRLALAAWLAALLVPLVTATTSAQPVNTASLSPARGPVGTRVTITGAGWPANRAVTITFGRDDYFEWLKGSVNADGTLALEAVVPWRFTSVTGATVLVTPGDYTVNIVTNPGPDRSTVVAAVTFTVAGAATAPPAIAWRFQEYYYHHDGGRLLGRPISEPRFEGGRRVQYFEKGRLEDHAGEPAATGPWRYQYGRLGAELAAEGSPVPVGGDTSSVTYAVLKELARPEQRLLPPPGWSGIVGPGAGEAVFVPVDTALQAAPGHYVPARFWEYINQPALFPAGWLHDIGLPLTEAIPATVTKTVNGERIERSILLQLFERTVLTDDPANPDGFQIERANLGSDYLPRARGPVVPGDVVLHPAFHWLDPAATDVNLPDGMLAPAWEWRSGYNRSIMMDGELPYLRQQLELEGWSVTAQTGGSLSGTLEAVKGERLQLISWWLGARPVIPPIDPDRGVQMRVLVGRRG
jgi:hypothetical protein